MTAERERITCGYCGKAYMVKPDSFGRQVTFQACHRKFLIVRESSAKTQAPAAPPL